MSVVEQRRTQRYDVEQQIRVRRGDEEVVGMTQNLSLGGASLRVELQPPAQIGERFEVSFWIPQLDKPIELQAEVRWRSGMDVACLGIQFVTGLRAKQTWALGQYFQSLQQGRQAEP